MPVVGAAGLEGPAPERSSRAVCMLGGQEGEDQEEGNPEEHGGSGGGDWIGCGASQVIYSDCGGYNRVQSGL